MSLTLPVRERVIERVRVDVLEYDLLAVEVIVERTLWVSDPDASCV